MNIETRNLIIRPFLLSDVDDVLAYMSDPEATYYLAEGSLSVEAVNAFVAETKQAFAIYHKQYDRLVGHIEFYPWFGDHTYEIGWIINPDYQKQGIAFEAATNVLQYGFEKLGVHRVVATAQPENPPSYRLMEKLGMVREGHFRECIPKEGGVWWDEYFYSMLKSDYQSLPHFAP
ncbi:TPA: GNAT family N-acetyltransferase [Vibrio cholerae]|nr:GNAT family N-acetyltransferase [Vibrio cholerae]HDV5468419.1 GNAT family N-acetyltransferase [Vibrio cholerae]HDV5472026.1 GNAT family N-acetyltransferase [Vibrio cholerae]HDV5542213.1 GNAT family N-acetyltransferase [Vibrio cholerae]HDV5545877.1 GNAT family N-acetyltransferase [Vibrio cholerae]